MLDRYELQWPKEVRDVAKGISPLVFNIIPSLPDDVVYFVQDRQIVGKIVDIDNG